MDSVADYLHRRSVIDSDCGGMDDGLRKEMMRYYDERAEEYDEIYSGRGLASDSPQLYCDDVRKITPLVSSFGEGNLVDIGSGTGFWLSYYAPNCATVTLVEQSARMLGECRKRIAESNLQEVCHLIQGDFFTLDIPGSFNSFLAGFFISHLPLPMEARFFARLKNLAEPGSQFMLIDSVWNDLRRRGSQKEGRFTRRLNDGRVFDIYKRYFDRADVEEMCSRNDLHLEDLYFGKVFFAAAGRRM